MAATVHFSTQQDGQGYGGATLCQAQVGHRFTLDKLASGRTSVWEGEAQEGIEGSSQLLQGLSERCQGCYHHEMR